jgi:hypothetical protein
MISKNKVFLQYAIQKIISTLNLNALLKPLAKKPPNGAIIEANNPRAKACHWTGIIATSCHGNCIIYK